MAIRTLVRTKITHYFPPTIFLKTFTSTTDNSSLLVNSLSRILSDYRNPHNDIESALHPFSNNISPNIIEQVLKRCHNLGFSAHRFFIWALRLPGFSHSKQSYYILVNILASSQQFPLLWDFLVENNKSCEFTQEIFWVIFKCYSNANLPVDAVKSFDKMVDFRITPSVLDVDQLLLALCKRKHMNEAKQFFDRVKDEFMLSVKSYSIMIRGWGELGEVVEARKLFDEMLERSFSVDLLAYNSVLESFCKAGKMDEAYDFFVKMKSMGLKPDAFTYSIFIHAYCVKDDIHSAFRVLDRMKRYQLVPNVFTYNCIIKTLCKSNKVEEAYQLLDEMIDRGVRPDCWSYNTILARHCNRNEVNLALRLIRNMDKNGCLPDRHTYYMVLKMLIKVGRFDRVEKVWESMEDRKFYPSVSTYVVMIHGLCQKKGKLEEACKYFEMMIDEGIPPYGETCQLLRNRLIGLGFAEQIEILAEKMERSTSCLVQELTNVMRGNRARAKLRCEEEYSDSDD